MEQLQEIYRRYKDELTAARKAAPPLAGVFGTGGTKDHPCHTIFYTGVGEWVENFLAGEPGEEEIFRAADYILSAAAGQKKKPAYLYCFVAQGHMKQLISHLSAEKCAVLRETFDALYPEQERLPLNQEVYALLCAQSGQSPRKKSVWDIFR